MGRAQVAGGGCRGRYRCRRRDPHGCRSVGIGRAYCLGDSGCQSSDGHGRRGAGSEHGRGQERKYGTVEACQLWGFSLLGVTLPLDPYPVATEAAATETALRTSGAAAGPAVTVTVVVMAFVLLRLTAAAAAVTVSVAVTVTVCALQMPEFTACPWALSPMLLLKPLPF